MYRVIMLISYHYITYLHRTYLALILTLACVFAAPAYGEINLIFGSYTADKPTETVRKFMPFLNYLSKEMTITLNEPVKIKLKIASDYEEGIENLTEGRVDFSRFGPASYVTAKARNPNIKIIAMESKKGKKTFKGIIAIHSDSTFTDLKDLKGHSFAFGDPHSTIGRYLAQEQLLNAGISGADLKMYSYLGRHDRVGAAVGNRDYDAGALKESTFKKLVAKNTKIKRLVTFDNVTKPWIASPNVPIRIYEAINRAMMGVTDTKTLESIAKSGFLPGSDADYDIIRAAMKHSESF
jgi:phosphonate transport system substrate-binding protein